MGKSVVRLHLSYAVMDTAKAVQLLELLSDCEQYEEKWRSREDGGPTKHIYPLDMGKVGLELLPDATYNMYKLAGKPEDK